MRNLDSRSIAAALAAFIGLAAALPVLAADVPAYVAAAVADPGRPAADTARDPLRKPAEMMVFAKIKPGQTVVEIFPGRGYFTRILSKVVGPAGHVYAAAPVKPGAPDTGGKPTGLAADPNYANVSDVAFPTGLAGLGPVDVVWTSQNYHDLHLPQSHLDVPAFDKTVFNLLKPGGEFIVIDHSALPGTGLEVPGQLHRINEDIVKQEVESAGFVLAAESDALRNPADPRTALVFDPSIRGHTDQFVLRFVKPK